MIEAAKDRSPPPPGADGLPTWGALAQDVHAAVDRFPIQNMGRTTKAHIMRAVMALNWCDVPISQDTVCVYNGKGKLVTNAMLDMSATQGGFLRRLVGGTGKIKDFGRDLTRFVRDFDQLLLAWHGAGCISVNDVGILGELSCELGPVLRVIDKSWSAQKECLDPVAWVCGQLEVSSELTPDAATVRSRQLDIIFLRGYKKVQEERCGPAFVSSVPIERRLNGFEEVLSVLFRP
jgi:hypothetical protein